MHLWNEELKNKDLAIDVIITQIQTFIITLIEIIFAEKELKEGGAEEEEKEMNDYMNEDTSEENNNNSTTNDQI